MAPQELRSYLLTFGFTNSIADTSLFTRKNGRDVVYIHNMLINGNNNAFLTSFIAHLDARFSLKDLGEMSYFLGIEATRTSKGLHLMQKCYILDLHAKTNILHARPVSTPMAPMPKLALTSGTPLAKPTEYRVVLGSL
ncbi:PREDICTED: uncharacterized protein LOC109133320 [Camelina sativa]|uniref:Uncharacterized protein LOC109133320 n=1 Tax=Camelina sativa TaxID=90675 RepID=A0ABM1RS86_CAMSA|nr:PREDICTED: uncharacterized protein LOC109133320 [Camelina sativa]